MADADDAPAVAATASGALFSVSASVSVAYASKRGLANDCCNDCDGGCPPNASATVRGRSEPTIAVAPCEDTDACEPASESKSTSKSPSADVASLGAAATTAISCCVGTGGYANGAE